MRNLNLPNLLSFSRLAMAPFAIRAILVREYREALGIFAVAAVTDALDGPLARHFHVATRLGAYLDPIADKALLSAAWVTLGVTGLAPWWLVILIFSRDLLILALAAAALLFTHYRDFPPSVWGKISTFFQVLAAVVVIVGRAFPGWNIWPDPLLWAAAAATAWSGLGYLLRARKMAGAAFRAT